MPALGLRASVVKPALWQETLQKLWSCAFPGEPWPEGLKSQRWTAMGWQRDDPTSDFRGGGYFSLQMLLYLAQVSGRQCGLRAD